MKRILMMTCLFVLLMPDKSQAQMAAAASVGWDISHSVELPIARDSVWSLLKDHSLVSKLSNEYTQSIVNKDNVMPILRETTFKDGTKREELLSQLEEQHRFLVFKINDSSLPQGIKSVQIAIFTKEKEDQLTEINWKIIMEGDREAKKKYLEVLKIEIGEYEKGFQNYLQAKPKIIRAVSMQ
ncbi:SRPBCC family protein [Sphingobacterium lumbrici]|uniref:hypothetical protein n=1 Tax=Sphingobacterium lumbrici TaxID=2559600 RepID=UPI001129F22B|nr:hypothetical protein [Sphingobacterium lumbrici]